MELAEPRERSEYSISRKPKYSLRRRYREVGESLSVLLFGAEQSIGPQGYWIFDPGTVSSIQNSPKLFTTLGGNVSPRMRTLFRVTIRGNGLFFACSVNEACRNALSRVPQPETLIPRRKFFMVLSRFDFYSCVSGPRSPLALSRKSAS